MEPTSPKVPATPPPRTAKPYALRFISGKYQGGEFPLPADGEIVIGRSSELDMVLVEDMVSRRHAKVTVGADQVFIQDLGSTNGTFVNGEKIKRVRLNDGDRILIGTSIIKLVAADPDQALRPPSPLEDVAARRTSQVRTMTGSISEIPVPDLLQLFSASRKSGVLVVRTETDTGKLFLKDGNVLFAAVNDNFEVAPMKSFIRILSWTEGSFDMEPPEDRAFKHPMQMSTEGLLMEAMRQIDEVKRLGADMPRLSAHVTIAMPLIPPLKDLSPEALDVLQLVHNYGHVETVLNKAAGDDVKTSETFVKLLKAGYIKVE